MAKRQTERYWARRPFGYEELSLDRGQAFELRGARNDEKLIRLGFVVLVDEKRDMLHQCPECGAEFIGMMERAGHVKARHRSHPLTPLEEDAEAERAERLLDEVAPLYIENAAANR